MSYSEDNLLPLSALQHFVFCRRQCALIHIEQLWTENVFTAEGRVLHEGVHEEKHATRQGMRVETGISLRSLRLGLIGKADVVEFHTDASGRLRQPFPVEYKRGKNKQEDCDRVQLCAQALCLEEMLQVKILQGALYYGKDHQRVDVIFDEALRLQTEETAAQLHELIRLGRTPEPVYEKKCDTCSFLNLCLPKTIGKKRSVSQFLNQQVKSI